MKSVKNKTLLLLYLLGFLFVLFLAFYTDFTNSYFERKIISHYHPYFFLAVLITVIFIIIMKRIHSTISLELFSMHFLELILFFSYVYKNFGFNALFKYCYNSFLFYFYLGLLLLMVFSLKYPKLFYVYFGILFLGLIILFSYKIARYISWSIFPGSFSDTFLEILILVVLLRHFYILTKALLSKQ